MLVLSRKRNQVVCIGAAVRIRVMGFQGDKVRLGIEAPEDTEVHREEVHREITQTREVRCCPHCGK